MVSVVKHPAGDASGSPGGMEPRAEFSVLKNLIIGAVGLGKALTSSPSFEVVDDSGTISENHGSLGDT